MIITILQWKGNTRNGIKNGLEIWIDVENYEYAYFTRGSTGFRIAIEDSRDKPIIEQNGHFVSPGSENLIAITPTIFNTTPAAFAFAAEVRDCYHNDEFELKYFTRDKNFRYSMQNCLYESLLEHILKECMCIPNFMSFNLDGVDYSVCRGRDLDCALEKIQNMGNEKFNLTIALDVDDNPKKCLQNCELQKHNIMQTSSNYPNWQTFPDRVDFCLILTKVIKICKDPIRKLGMYFYKINFKFFLKFHFKKFLVDLFTFL